eukprot:4243419-Prymnesium_polylepis.1
MDAATTNLPSIVRERVLEMLREAAAAAQPRSDYTALVVDETTLRVLSRGITVSELMDEANAVTVVDAIHAPRESRAPEELASRMDVVYFLAPTHRSVRALLADYNGPEPVYEGSAHVFFSRRLPDELLALLKGSSLVRRIRTLRELNLDFVALHPHGFSLDAPSALHELYGPWGAASRAHVVERYAEQLCTLCTSLGEQLPHVRYSKTAHPIAKSFAKRLASMLTERSTAAGAAAAQRRRPRATV